MNISLAEATMIQQQEDDAVLLWYVRGKPGCFYPSKMTAELVARRDFPNEGPGERYARIFYKRFHAE